MLILVKKAPIFQSKNNNSSLEQQEIAASCYSSYYSRCPILEEKGA